MPLTRRRPSYRPHRRSSLPLPMASGSPPTLRPVHGMSPMQYRPPSTRFHRHPPCITSPMCTSIRRRRIPSSWVIRRAILASSSTPAAPWCTAPYVYEPYVGAVYYGYPATYGYGAGFALGTTVGFAFGFAIGASWGPPSPYWGPYWGGGGPMNWQYANVNQANIYGRWGQGTVTHASGWNGWTGRSWSGTAASGFNPYTGGHFQASRGAVQNAYNGNFAAGREGSFSNPSTGRSGAARGGVAGNAYNGNYAAGRQAAGYNAQTGRYGAAGAGVTGNANSGEHQAGSRGVVGNANTGRSVAWNNGNVYAGNDGNVYKHDQGGRMGATHLEWLATGHAQRQHHEPAQLGSPGTKCG